MKKFAPCLLLLTGSVLLAGCASSKCEELRKVVGADPAIMGMTREDECERALEQFKGLNKQLQDLQAPYRNAPTRNDPEHGTDPLTEEDKERDKRTEAEINQGQAWIQQKLKEEQASSSNSNQAIISRSAVKEPQETTRLKIHFVDQYGLIVHHPYHSTVRDGYDIGLLDALGDPVQGYFERDGDTWIFNKDMKPGRYTVTTPAVVLKGTYTYNYFTNPNTRPQHAIWTVDRWYDASKVPFTVPQDNNWNVTVTVPQLKHEYGYILDIRFIAQNELGNPLAIHSVEEKDFMTNSAGKRIPAQFMQINSANGLHDVTIGESYAYESAVRVGNQSLPPDTYTLHINQEGYEPVEKQFTLRDVSNMPDEQVIAGKIGAINIGTITLKKKM